MFVAQQENKPSSSSQHPKESSDGDRNGFSSAQVLQSGKRMGQDSAFRDSEFSVDNGGPLLSPRAAARAEIQKQMEANKAKMA